MSRQFIIIDKDIINVKFHTIYSEQDVIDRAYECSSDCFGEEDYEELTLDNAVAYLTTQSYEVKELIDFQYDIIMR